MNEEQIIIKKADLAGDDYLDLRSMMNEEAGIKEIFGGRYDRLMTTSNSWIIKVNGKKAGFISLVTEKANHRFLFLDMGIIKEYRGKGYGKKFLEEVKQIVEKEKDFPYVLMETKQDNDNANGISKVVGCYLTSFEDRNVYLLQKSKLQEFIDTNQMEELAKHYEKKSSKKDIVKQYL